MPLTSQPTPTGQRINGFSDIVATAFFSPSKVGRFMWGAGARRAAALRDQRGNRLRKIRVGAVHSLAETARQMDDWLPWKSGLVGRRRQRSRSGQPGVPSTLCFYNMGNGMSAGLNMEATVKWEADNGKATAPAVVEHQQGCDCWQAPRELPGWGRSNDCQPGRRPQMAVSFGSYVSVPPVTYAPLRHWIPLRCRILLSSGPARGHAAVLVLGRTRSPHFLQRRSWHRLRAIPMFRTEAWSSKFS